MWFQSIDWNLFLLIGGALILFAIAVIIIDRIARK